MCLYHRAHLVRHLHSVTVHCTSPFPPPDSTGRFWRILMPASAALGSFVIGPSVGWKGVTTRPWHVLGAPPLAIERMTSRGPITSWGVLPWRRAVRGMCAPYDQRCCC